MTFAITQPESGKYYRIVNQNPDKSVNTEGVRHGYVITENTTSHGLNATEPGSDTKYNQIWKYTGSKFQNAHTSRYINTLSRSVQGVTSTSGANVTISDKGTYFLLTCGMQIHADGSNVIVGWNDEGNKSNWWDFEEVTVDQDALAIVQEQYKKEQEEKAALEAIAAKSDSYAKIVAGYFTDAACTQLNDACSKKSDAQMKEMMTADGLPTELQTIILRIKNKWSDELNPTLSERFRIQDYKCYTQADIKHTPKSTQMSDQNNPTGIWTNTLQLMYVFVGDDIPEGTSLRIASSDGAEVSRVWWSNGTALKKGLNILYCSADNAYQWIMYTAPGQIGKRIDRFPTIKIHIEGGDVLGYADVAGKDEAAANAEYELTLKNAKAIMAQKGVSTKKMNFAVKGERGLMLFPVDAYNQIWGDQAWNGKKYGYKIYKSMKFYDNVLMWEWSAMGWQDRVEAGEALDTHEHLAAGAGDAWYPSYINNLAPTMMYYAGKNPYSSDGYTCMPSVGAIESSYNAERADFDVWCVGHESGHNNQGTINLPSSMESSNNYFSNVIQYLCGYRLSRGMSFMENMDYVQDNIVFPQRSISMTLRMYFNLYLYYHRAQNNMQFSQKLHKLLRADGMTFGGDGWLDGSFGGANMGTAANSWLKFYEKACEAAGEDLTEYFRLWGFFIPTDKAGGSIEKANGKYYAYCGDYSSYYITCSQKDIDAAIARVKKKGYRENKEIMFIEDRLKPQKRWDVWSDGSQWKVTSDGGDASNETQLKEWYGDLGYADEYIKGQASKADGYSYTVAGRKVTMKGQGGVGIIVYNEDGTIGYLSNRLTFTMPAEVAAGNFTIKVIQGDGVEVEAENAINSSDPAVQKDALQAAVEASKELTNLVDDKTVGFYTTASVADLLSLVEQANAALKSGDTSKYKELAQAIGNEIINVNLNAKKNELKTNAVYTLRNYQFKNQGGASYLSGTNTSAVSDGKSTSSQWLFVPISATSNKYYLQNRSSLKLISNVGDNGAFKAEAESAANGYKFTLGAADGGTFYIQFTNSEGSTKCINETPSWNGIISWGEGEGSRWYISEVEEIEGITGEELQGLISNTQSLISQAGTISTSVQKLALQCTDANAPYYIKTNREDTSFPLKNIIDGDKSTNFRTKKGTAYSNITIDLGEGNEANYLRLTCTTTTAQDGTSPKTIVAMPSTGMSSGFVTKEKSEFTGLADGSNKTYYNDTKEAAKEYRYWRFQVTETQSESTGYPIFSLAEIQIRTLVATVTLNEAYSTLDTKILKSANAACKTAQDKYKTLSSLLSNTATYNDLKAAYDALLAAMEAIAPTAVETIETATEQNSTIYDMQGRRLNKIGKSGLYIINGKKVLVK